MTLFGQAAAFAIGLTGLALAGPLQAQPLALDAQSVASQLKALKLPAEVVDRAPALEEIDSDFGQDAGYTIYLSQCVDHRNCKVLQFYAGYTESDAGLAEINAFNRQYRFARATIDDESEPALAMDVRTEALTSEEFASIIEDWRSLMSAFSETLYPD